MASRTPFIFHARYCDGHKDSMGYWTANGRSELAETELTKRLALLLITHPRDIIWATTPPKKRQVIQLDIGEKDEVLSLKKLPSETSYFKAMERILPLYTDDVIEKVMESLLVGEKTIIWLLTRQSVEIMATQMERACEARDVISRLRAANCRLWATHGEADIKARTDLAADFREHQGAGVIMATMDSMPESISLFGATTEHYPQPHYLSGPMEQSENRPYLRGTSKLHIFYYVPKGTVIERMIGILLPRLTTAALIGGSKDADATAKMLGQKTESWEDFLARLTSRGPEDGEAVIGGDFSAEDLLNDDEE